MTSERKLRPYARAGRSKGGRLLRFLRHDLWMIEIANLSRVRAAVTRVVRIVFIAGRGFLRDRCMQQAAALTYLTIFTLPAFLALVFSLAKGFDAFGKLKAGPIDGFIDQAFPLTMAGPDGTRVVNEGSARIRELVDQVFAYVENANLKVLGTFGVLFLVYATLKMLSSVERSFNEIWGVQRPRTFLRRLSDYLAIVAITPVALLVGTAFTGFVSSQGGRLQGVLGLDLEGPLLAAVPLTSICLGMTLAMMTLPNTRVKLVPAVVGGVVSGVAWQVVQLVFVESQLGLTRANAVFSSFAAVPLLLTWIYVSWVVLFSGAELSFAIQNERAVTSIARTGVVDQRFRDAVGPRLAARVTAAFLAGDRPPDVVALAGDLGIAPRAALDVLENLVRHGFLAETPEDETQGYLPARDPESVSIVDLMRALRVEEGGNPIPVRARIDERVDATLDAFERTLRASPENATLAELARELLAEREEAARREASEEDAPAPVADAGGAVEGSSG